MHAPEVLYIVYRISLGQRPLSSLYVERDLYDDHINTIARLLKNYTILRRQLVGITQFGNGLSECEI